MSVENSDYIYSISGLFLKKGHTSETIIEDINEFISAAPGLAEKIRLSLPDSGDSHNFIQHMTEVQSLLKYVSAKWLQTEAEAIISSAKANDMDSCRKKVEPFIADLLSLSIEMQMAQKRAADAHGNDKKNVIEAYTDIVNILTAVSRLIAINEYDRVRELLTDMDDLGDNNDFVDLIQSLNPSTCEMVENRVKQLRDKYIADISELEGSKSVTKKEILAVDDRPDVLRMVAGVLRERFRVLTATDGAGALKILEKKTPELFILDIDMPGMNGFELAQKIRLMSDFNQTPILFLTSNSAREYIQKATESGGSDLIVKPAKQSTLMTKVSKYLFT